MNAVAVILQYQDVVHQGACFIRRPSSGNGMVRRIHDADRLQLGLQRDHQRVDIGLYAAVIEVTPRIGRTVTGLATRRVGRIGAMIKILHLHGVPAGLITEWSRHVTRGASIGIGSYVTMCKGRRWVRCRPRGFVCTSSSKDYCLCAVVRAPVRRSDGDIGATQRRQRVGNPGLVTLGAESPLTKVYLHVVDPEVKRRRGREVVIRGGVRGMYLMASTAIGRGRIDDIRGCLHCTGRDPLDESLMRMARGAVRIAPLEVSARGVQRGFPLKLPYCDVRVIIVTLGAILIGIGARNSLSPCGSGFTSRASRASRTLWSLDICRQQQYAEKRRHYGTGTDRERSPHWIDLLRGEFECEDLHSDSSSRMMFRHEGLTVNFLL